MSEIVLAPTPEEYLARLKLAYHIWLTNPAYHGYSFPQFIMIRTVATYAMALDFIENHTSTYSIAVEEKPKTKQA